MDILLKPPQPLMGLFLKSKAEVMQQAMLLPFKSCALAGLNWFTPARANYASK